MLRPRPGLRIALAAWLALGLMACAAGVRAPGAAVDSSAEDYSRSLGSDGTSRPDAVERSTVALGVSLIVFVFLTGRALPRWWNAFSLLLPLQGLAVFAHSLAVAWPASRLSVSFVRAVAGGVAAAVVIRETFLPQGIRWLSRRLGVTRERDFSSHRSFCVGTLAVCGILALAAFANLGYPQFWDSKTGTPRYIHDFDMRVYYPVAKYFRELRYDGLYRASLLAYAEDVTGGSLAGLENVPFRDLRTHRLTKVGANTAEIHAIRERFTTGRWRAFVSDMCYFREALGAEWYLLSITDHGANATPVWMSTAHMLFARTRASDSVFLVGAALDPILLALAFVAIGRTFGARTMLVSMVVFGANDYYQFGSNWFGSTLRHDWMALLALGVCALSRARFVLGGSLLAWAGLIRAFPALALAGVIVPLVWWLVGYRRANHRWPTMARLATDQRPVIRTLRGAALTTIAWLAISSALFGTGIWAEWLDKTSLLATGPQINNVGLRTLVTYDRRGAQPGADWVSRQTEAIRERRGVLILTAAVFVALAAVVLRRSAPAEAAVVGMLLVPIALYAANYYAHFVFLVPLLAAERPGTGQVSTAGALIWATITGACLAQYGSVLAPSADRHFALASWILVATIAAVLATLAIAHEREERALAPLAGSHDSL